MDLVTATMVGAVIGVGTGLLPGLHVNTIAAVAFAVAPTAGPSGAVMLLAVGVVHTIVTIIPATYLGAPDDDDVVAVLPAHRLLLAGRGAEAVAVSVAASLLGVIGAILLAFGLHQVLASPTLLARIDAWTPFVLMAVLVLLWLQEHLRGAWGPVKAAAVSLAAGGLGLLGSKLPLTPLVTIPPTSLLPLLGGLFGGAGLSMAMQRPPVIPWQPDLRKPVRRSTPALVGTVLAAITALMPGLTSAVAAAMMPGIRGRPLHAIAAMSSINTAHAVLAIVVWLSVGRIRTGLADGLDRWSTAAWSGDLPGASASLLLLVVIAAAALGAVATMVMDHLLRRRADRLPSRGLSATGLSFLTTVVIVLSGWLGLVFYLLAIAVGRIPLRIGVRRVHLVGCLIIPAIIWQWT